MTAQTFDDYRMLHAEVVRVIRAASPQELNLVCEACPDWTVRQLVGHMVHTLGSSRGGGLPMAAITDAVSGDTEQKRADGARIRDEWTHVGAASFGSLPLEELLAEWDLLVADEPEVGLLLIPDVAVHLDDIAETLAVDAGTRRLVMLGLSRYSSPHAAALQSRGLPAVQLRCTDGDERLGDIESDLIVSGAAYDLCRVMMGRRTPAEAESLLDWGIVPVEIRHNFPLYGSMQWGRDFSAM